MELNLKRALKLRRSIEAHLKGMSISTTGSINILSPDVRASPIDSMFALRTVMLDQIGQYQGLSSVLSRLRSDILKVNVELGVENLLAELADMDRHIKVLKDIVDTKDNTDEGVIREEVRLAVAALENPTAAPSVRSIRDYTMGMGGGSSRTVSVSLMTEEIRTKARSDLASLRGARDDAEDARNALNAKARIQITDDGVELLRKVGLV